MRWGEKETLIFSKSYLRQTCLWNPEHPMYKVKAKRLHAYREIMAQFYDATGIKLSEIEVKLKIKNLRSTYTQEKTKIRQRSNEEWTYKPSLKWFYDWHRCFSSIKKNEDLTLDAGIDFNDVVHDDTEEPMNDVWPSPADEMSHSDPGQDSDDFKLLDLKPEPNDSSSDKRSHKTNYKLKKKKMKHQRHPSTDESVKNEIFRSISDSSSSKEDEFDIYGKYIATQLRNMGLQKALRVQVEIQSLVSEARISDLVDK